MEEADSDALLLYDCCNSAATKVSGAQLDQISVTEVIAACGYESVAPEVGKHSFTNALTETLAASSNGAPFSISILHNRIMDRLKCWTPSIAKDQNGKMKADARGNLEYERQPRRTPIYSVLCETKHRRSILLAPLREREGQLDLASSTLSQVKSLNRESSKTQLHHKRKRPLSPIKENKKSSQVVISVQLRGDDLDVSAWTECIRLFPAEAQDIKIEGIFESFSTLLLIRVPVAVWNLLPENPAYGFVGYVTSENQVVSRLKARVSQEVPNPSTSTAQPPKYYGILKCSACRRHRQKVCPFSG